MAALKQWQEQARLAHLITQELGNEHRNGVMGRWMAQRVAELMRRAETTADPVAKEAAERECQDLVIRLWESRESWPSDGPLGSVLPTLNALLAKAPDYRHWRSQPEENQPVGWITQLLQLQRKELRHFCLAVRNQIPAPIMEALTKLLADHKADLSEEEVTVLYYITNPTRLSFFSLEEELDSAEDDNQNKNELAPMVERTKAVDQFADFLKYITHERQAFLARLTAAPTKLAP
jgi:hypothetical protein